MAYLISHYCYNVSYNCQNQYSASFSRPAYFKPIVVCPQKLKFKEIIIPSKPKRTFRRGEYIAVGDKLIKVKRLKVECKSDKTTGLTSSSTKVLEKYIKDAKEKNSKNVWGYREKSGSCKIYEFSALQNK